MSKTIKMLGYAHNYVKIIYLFITTLIKNKDWIMILFRIIILMYASITFKYCITSRYIKLIYPPLFWKR